MSRKFTGVMAGWLAAVSVAVAQSGQPAGKTKPLSPYYPTASTVDWSNDSDLPELLPPPPAKAAPPAAAPSQIKQASAIQPPAPPVSIPGPPASTPPPPAATPVVPAAPSPSANPNKATQPPTVGGTGPGCSSGTCGTCGTCGTGGSPWSSCNTCGCTGPCGPAGRVWADAELLLWWNRGMNVPPLVTCSPAGTPRALAGVLGAPGTRVLFGGDKVNDEMEPGFRVRAGLWLDDCQTCGLEGSFFFVGQQSTDKTFDCLSCPVLARPFIDVNPAVPNPFNGIVGIPAPNSELVCFPGVLNGTVNVHATTDLYGFDANYRHNVICECDRRVDFLVGYRYLNLKDQVAVTENLQVLSNANPALPAGTTFIVHDQFDTTNTFNGGQVGVAGERRRGRWVLGGRALVGMGNTHSEVNISGFTRAQPPGAAPILNAGGLLTQGTNIGTFTDDKFSWIYEAQTMLGYQVTDGVRVFVSYSYLWWDNVARAGDQIDLVVNSSQIPPGTLNGLARPVFVKKETDFWTQGISFGVEVRY